ncbi:MAG: hypothetical protein ACD_46C00286G0005 [uncultured bacterium]|nr:MAG: hypothetical protein ACD_46C00286G0005 [uncultured bacterium]
MNRDNPVEDISTYTSTPPCSEMGLAPGETCQFGYINIVHFITSHGVNYNKLSLAARIMTRALDNAIEVSMTGYPDADSRQSAQLKRKIGIGVCGLADSLIIRDIPYDTEKARQFTRDVLSFINFQSKLESVELAEKRGSCKAMNNFIANKYYAGNVTKSKLYFYQ